MPIANDQAAGPAVETRDGANIEPGAAGAAGVRVERRRPGRMQHVSPALLGLLRSRAGAPVPAAEDEDSRGAIATAQGVLVAVLLGVLMWVGGIWLVAALLR